MGDKRSRERLAKLQSKLNAEDGKFGHDLAPEDWVTRLLSFGSGKEGQLGCSMLLDSNRDSCCTSPCWVTLEAAEGEYGLRTPSQISCGANICLASMESGDLYW